MFTASCRDGNDPGDQRDDWRDGGFSEIKHPPAKLMKFTRTALILVHGFASKLPKVVSAYTEMAKVQSRDGNGGLDVYGFTWPSEGNIRYFSDLLHVRKSKRALHQFIKSLRHKGYDRIAIQCHSMGSILVMEMLCEDYCKPGEIQEIIIHGGDASRKKFKKRRKYGKNSFKVDRLHSFWSKNDRVLRLARFLRPARRVGRHELPGRKPDNFISYNYSMDSHGVEIRHSSYRKSKEILNESVRLATGGE